jgi:hypothetical protein
MILVDTKKIPELNKHFVISWYCVTKAQLRDMKLKSSQKVFNHGDIPKGFYTNSSQFFVEEGILRNGYGILKRIS